jgi:predicted MFS family arabinose efflux permease
VDHSTLTAKQEWRSGWTLVLAASLGFSFFSVMLASTGLFMEPLGKEFGWSRTLLSSGPSIATFTTALLGPFFGMLIDRFGTRRLVLPGLVLTMISICAFSLANGSKAQWLALWVVFGIVSVSIKSTAWTTAVVGVFEKSRGLALALTLAGTAAAASVVPPLGNFLITEFGWRAAFVWLALGWGGITLLVCLLFLFDVRDRAAGKRKADERAGLVPTREAPVDLPGLTASEAWRDSALWRLAISNFIVMVLTIGLAIHLFPILTEAGVSRANAAWLTGLAGIAGIVGKLVTGVLLDRFRPNWVGGITLGAAALAFALLLDGIRSPALIVVALLVNGYAAGTKTHITSFLTAGYAGMKNFGAIYGVMSSLMALASGMGPMLAGLTYDLSGGYRLFLLAGTVGCTLSGLLIISMPAYPDWTSERKPRGRARPGQASSTIDTQVQHDI